MRVMLLVRCVQTVCAAACWQFSGCSAVCGVRSSVSVLWYVYLGGRVDECLLHVGRCLG